MYIGSDNAYKVKYCHPCHRSQKRSEITAVIIHHGQDIIIYQSPGEKGSLNAGKDADDNADHDYHHTYGVALHYNTHQPFKYLSRILDLYASGGSHPSAMKLSYFFFCHIFIIIVRGS